MSKRHEIDSKRTIKDITLWLGRRSAYDRKNKNELRDLADKVLRGNATSKEFSLMASNLGPISFNCFQVGASKLLAGKSDGWAAMYVGSVFDILKLELLKSFTKNDVLRHEDMFLSGMVSYLMNDGDVFARTVELYESYPKLFDDPPRRYFVALAKFIRDMHVKKKLGPVPTAAKAGPYADVIRHWGKDAERVVKAIAACCDYHLERRYCFNLSEGDRFTQPFYLIPIEIMALFKLARDQKWELPEVEHPLLQLSIPPPPKKAPKLKDRTLQKLKSKFLFYDKVFQPKVKS